MALAFRIDGYTQYPDGRVEVRYTAAPEWLTPDLALRFVIAIWKTLQPAMNNPTVIVGKTLTFDPASLTATMRVA